MNNPSDILKRYWGYDSFRPLQEEIIASVLSGHDTLGLLPTGGGKSITFQVPALAMGGLTIVVTPLISLMKDQCDNLSKRGIKAAAVFMGMTHQEILNTYELVIAQDYRFLYISPERLETQLFQAKLHYMKVSLLVVDEAHCISQWGYDFRPPYLKIANLRTLLAEILPRQAIPCLALTATATPEVVDDIQDKLRFRRGAQVFRASFARPNLTYSVITTYDKPKVLCELLEGMEPGASAIVYVRSRRQTEEVADELSRQGIAAAYYHAGLKAADKQKRQDDWMAGYPAVIVATNAFGMGIDKPNVRLVVHLDLPPSPEEYFQEAGRAGRDGQPARAILLTVIDDQNKLRQRMLDEYPDRDFIRHVYGRLASFFQIAVGAGYNNMFEFDIYRFCSAYHLPMGSVHYSLKLLDQAGYISYIEEPDRHSRLMITASREALYHLNQFDAECQRILQALLRQYTGLFADFVYIYEDQLVKATGYERQLIYEKLQLLTRFHVLQYIPARRMPAIYYLTPRLEDCELRFPHAIYEDRQKRQEARIKAMCDYVNNDQECRQVQLLHYFGEELDLRCGNCDVCLGESLPAHVYESESMIRQLITDLLKARGPLAPQQIISLVRMPAEQVSAVLRQMVVSEELHYDDNIVCL